MQGFRRLALFVGATSLAGGAVFVVACGTDNGSSTVPTPQVDAGKTDTGTTPVDSGGGIDSAAPDSGPVDCSRNPVLRDDTSGFGCAFLGLGDGGAATCQNTETCCNGAKSGGVNQKSFCASAKGGDTVCAAQAADAGTTYVAGSAAWECADKHACSGGQVCCMIQDPARLALDPVKNKLNIGNSPPTNTTHPAACKAQYAYNAGGSRCKAACDPALNDLILCSLSDNSCGAGTTCTPFTDFTNFAGVDRGYCK